MERWEALRPLGELDIRFEQAVLEAAQRRQQDDEAQMEAEYLALKPWSARCCARTAEQGPRFRPYDGEALAFYRDKVGRRVSPQMSQRALEALREPRRPWVEITTRP